MPRFHFHLTDGQSHRDDEGADLPDPEAARAYALRYLCDVLEGSQTSVWESGGVRLDVADESGLTLFELYVVAVDAPAAGLRADLISSEPKQP